MNKTRIEKRIRSLAIAAILLLTMPLLAYIPETNLDSNGNIIAVRWADSFMPLTWRMNPTVSPNVTGDREQVDVFRNSFQQWADVTTSDVTLSEGLVTDPSVKPGLDLVNLITTNVTKSDFNSTALGLTIAFSFTSTGTDAETGTVIEFAGQVIDADIMFNPDLRFSLSTTIPPDTDRFDLESVATHAVGHLLGLDHSNILSSAMFPTILAGVSFPRTIGLDDMIGLSSIYPDASFSSLGSISGTVRTTANAAVFGAMVVALDPNGQAAASAVTNPAGLFTIQGLSPGNYTVYAEPMNQPFTVSDVLTLSQTYPGQSVNTNFTVRYR
jgi:hypothetical protein